MGRPATRHRSTLGAALILASGAVCGRACNVERDYELLSFFFGRACPSPPRPWSEGEGPRPRFNGSSRMTMTGAVSAHSAYVERRCPECQGNRSRFGFTTAGFTDLTAAICVDCHEPALQAPRLHGPVALGDCLLCHEAHVSAHPLAAGSTLRRRCVSDATRRRCEPPRRRRPTTTSPAIAWTATTVTAAMIPTSCDHRSRADDASIPSPRRAPSFA